MKNKIVLGIETSCDDTSVCLLEGQDQTTKILSHISFSQEKLLKKWGGVVPEIASRNHVAKLTPLLEEAFNEANLTPHQIDLIGVTTHPGLLGPLLTGLNAAKTISLIHKKSIVAVNHIYAHLEAIHLTDKINYPYLGMVVSGGNSLFILVKSSSDFVILGSTVDDAAGEAFDKGAKLMGLGYPGGVIIDQLAKNGDTKRFKFPVGLAHSQDATLSFSGVKTSLATFLKENPEFKYVKGQEFEQNLFDLCACYQEAITQALKLKMKYAIEQASQLCTSPFEIVVGGGVACNSNLRHKLTSAYPDVYFVKPQFCTDNGAMIANWALRNEHQKVPFPDCLSMDASGRFINKTKTKKSSNK
ncbi:MAG: tRNA (adenosine(37)-N6)-threonylcarbamoyltransferase complex transferase subunit TsaD [Bacteriovoracaceae bacterium]|nr:tRNA (adenosine(37)-N6)-threonylcarbamoyltransferase complex transferase subunit TsaD [Bacteriovoracaceae bacterium]